MLQKIEVSFKECVRKNILNKNANPYVEDPLEFNSTFASASIESSSGAICSSNSDTQEPSYSFRVNLGRDEKEEKISLKKFQDMHSWLWKECFSPLTLCALMYGKRRCSPLLGICDTCFVMYDAKEDLCPCCHRMQHNVGDQQYSYEQFNRGINHLDEADINFPNGSPPRIRLIKALLTLLEVF